MPRRGMGSGPIIAGAGIGVALGVALGTFAVAPVVDGESSASAYNQVREEYRKNLQSSKILEAQMASGDSIISDLAPTTVDGTLVQRPVLVMTTSTAQDGDVSAVQSLLKSSDIVNAGTIELSDGFFKQENADTVESLLANTLPAGATLSTDTMSMGLHAGEALGAALFLNPDTTQPLAKTDERAVLLRALRDKGFINYEDGTILPAQAIVVIDGKTDGEGSSAFRATNLADMMKGFAEVGEHAVLAARIESTADKGPIGILRADAKSTVSTVDSIDRSWARMATVLAVREQLDGGDGAYGSAASADAAAPAVPQVY